MQSLSMQILTSREAHLAATAPSTLLWRNSTTISGWNDGKRGEKQRPEGLERLSRNPTPGFVKFDTLPRVHRGSLCCPLKVRDFGESEPCGGQGEGLRDGGGVGSEKLHGRGWTGERRGVSGSCAATEPGRFPSCVRPKGLRSSHGPVVRGGRPGDRHGSAPPVERRAGGAPGGTAAEPTHRPRAGHPSMEPFAADATDIPERGLSRGAWAARVSLTPPGPRSRVRARC